MAHVLLLGSLASSVFACLSLAYGQEIGEIPAGFPRFNYDPVHVRSVRWVGFDEGAQREEHRIGTSRGGWDYLIGRAVAEPFVIDLTNPASYRNDWGGPSLAGVLAVHCGPGILSLAAMVAALRRRRPSIHSGQ